MKRQPLIMRADNDELADIGTPMPGPFRHMQFGLPFMPPPLSACFVNVSRNGRADSGRYKAFKTAVDRDLASNWPGTLGNPYKPTFSGDVRVRYSIIRPDKRARDLDNLCKALNDTLVRNFILKDDSQIVDLNIRWASVNAHQVFVEITEVTA